MARDTCCQIRVNVSYILIVFDINAITYIMLEIIKNSLTVQILLRFFRQEEFEEKLIQLEKAQDMLSEAEQRQVIMKKRVDYILSI